jgi:hypothetical protein
MITGVNLPLSTQNWRNTMEMKNAVVLFKTKNDKVHQYFVDPTSTKGEVFDCLSEWRLEIFKSMQDDMAAEKPKDAQEATPTPDISPEAAATTT